MNASFIELLVSFAVGWFAAWLFDTAASHAWRQIVEANQKTIRLQHDTNEMLQASNKAAIGYIVELKARIVQLEGKILDDFQASCSSITCEPQDGEQG
jgi:hypothetical protein